MKKIYGLFLLLVGINCFTSCGDDDYTYTAPETLNVTNADLYFTSSGGKGSVEIESNTSLKATSSVDWCTVSVSGGLVTATVIENGSLESRGGTITISDGTLTSLVAVYQEGVSCSIDMSDFKAVNPNTASSTSVIVESSSPYTVSIPSFASSWLSYTDQDGIVTFNIATNSTGYPRGAKVTIVSGPKTETFLIAQYDIQNIVGSWEARYLDYDKLSVAEQIEITSPTDGVLSLTFNAPAAGSSIPVFTCNYVDGTIKVLNATALGRYYTYYLFSVVFSQDGYVSWSPNYTCTGYPNVTEDGTFYFEFGDDGSWPSKVITGIGVNAFSSATPTSTGHAGNLATYDYLQLYKNLP